MKPMKHVDVRMTDQEQMIYLRVKGKPSRAVLSAVNCFVSLVKFSICTGSGNNSYARHGGYEIAIIYLVDPSISSLLLKLSVVPLE